MRHAIMKINMLIGGVFMRKIICFVLIFIIAFALISCGNEDAINEDDSLETKVEKIALKEAFKKEENIIETNFIDDAINNGKVIIRLNLNGKDSGRITLLDKSKNVMQKLFNLDEISEVQLIWNANLVDQYGKVENMKVLKIILKKETANKIGWDMFDVNQFENISDSYWAHDAYKK